MFSIPCTRSGLIPAQDTNIPGLGQIPSRAQEDEEQVAGLNLGTRVPTPSDSRAFASFQRSPPNPNDLPTYIQSQLKVSFHFLPIDSA